MGVVKGAVYTEQEVITVDVDSMAAKFPVAAEELAIEFRLAIGIGCQGRLSC